MVVPLCSPAQTDTTAMSPPEQEALIVQGRAGTLTGVVETPVNDPILKYHSPRKAAIMSATLPGLGQVYNKKYWKVPIIYGGFAAAGYYLNDNIKNIRRFKDAYIAETDGDPNTVNTTGLNSTKLLTNIDLYTQWRDLSYIAIGIIYVLNIIDASVDAHLFHFDVSEDISLNVQPAWNPMVMRTPGLTLIVKL